MTLYKQSIENTLHYTLEQIQKEYPSAEAAISASQDHGLLTSVRLGKTDAIEHSQNNHLEITLYNGHQKGLVTTNNFSQTSINEAIQKAWSIAHYTSSDTYNGLPEKSLLASNIPELDLYHPWKALDTSLALSIATECEAIALQNSKISNSEGCSVESYDGTVGYANTQGFLHSYNTSSHSIGLSLIAEQAGHMQRDSEYTTSRIHTNLEDITSLAEKAVDKTLKKLGAQRPKTGHYPVIFTPQMSRTLISALFTAISGTSQYKKNTFLLNQLHQPIFPEWLSITETPHLLQEIGSRPYDDEGVQLHLNPIIKQGALSRYLLSSYSAKKLGLTSTGNAGGISNITLTNSGLSFNELAQKMGNGILVTEMMGQGTNITNGNYSRGASGFYIENGVIQHALEEFTVAGNLKEMFQNIIAIGNDVDLRSSIQTGSILVDNLMVAGS